MLYHRPEMRLRRLEDREALEAWLRRDAALHVYELGDLDDFFWPHTTWYGLVSAEASSDLVQSDAAAVALLYTATELPVLLLLGDEDARPAARALLSELRSVLPSRFYAHLVPGIAETFGPGARVEHHGRHDRMILVDRSRIDAVETSSARPLGPADREEVLAFFRRAYPGNWFDPRMLATDAYFGVRDGCSLVSVGGVHVVSRSRRVAALGNVATDPSARGRGLAGVVTAAVCKSLGPAIDPIGLNVASDNHAAIAVYRRLGFERVASYEEVLVTL